MKQILKVLLFLTGLVLATASVPRKYYLILTDKTWSDARDYCRTNHDDLAIIDSPANMARLQSDPQSKYTLSSWIGMSLQPSHFMWSNGNESLGTFNLWGIGWPNNAFGNQHCTIVFGGLWYTSQCDLQKAFVCYDDSETDDDQFIFYSTPTSWFDAQSFCREEHTDLASVETLSEQFIINEKVQGETWIGLFREPWKWVDQTDVTTFTWVPGQPDNLLLFEDCGLMENYQVADNLCTDVNPFICQRDVTHQQQIIKMTVQSDQDLNVPTLMQAILKMIQEKLKDCGIDLNITLKWREQQDGVTFYKLE